MQQQQQNHSVQLADKENQSIKYYRKNYRSNLQINMQALIINSWNRKSLVECLLLLLLLLQSLSPPASNYFNHSLQEITDLSRKRLNPFWPPLLPIQPWRFHQNSHSAIIVNVPKFRNSEKEECIITKRRKENLDGNKSLVSENRAQGTIAIYSQITINTAYTEIQDNVQDLIYTRYNLHQEMWMTSKQDDDDKILKLTGNHRQLFPISKSTEFLRR